MAIKKATIQQQVAAAIAQANPADRPIVTIQAIAGPSVWLMSMLGLIGQAVSHVLLHHRDRAGRGRSTRRAG